jgi:hypothetical protein
VNARDKELLKSHGWDVSSEFPLGIWNDELKAAATGAAVALILRALRREDRATEDDSKTQPSTGEDTVRVVRVYEFSGPRKVVEDQVQRSLKDGTHRRPIHSADPVKGELTIRVATLGQFPEVAYRGFPGNETQDGVDLPVPDNLEDNEV